MTRKYICIHGYVFLIVIYFVPNTPTPLLLFLGKKMVGSFLILFLFIMSFGVLSFSPQPPLFHVHFFYYAFWFSPTPFFKFRFLSVMFMDGVAQINPHLPLQILLDVGLFIGRLLQLLSLVQYAFMLSFGPYILLEPMFELVLILCNLHFSTYRINLYVCL